MRRRTFIQTLPLAAAGAAATMPDKANAQAQGVHATTIAGRFAEVSSGGRGAIRSARRSSPAIGPSGASFATRSPALGLNGAAGTAHPLATQTAIAMLKRGGSRSGRGGRGERRAGICGAGQLRPGRRLLRVRLGSEGRQACGHGQLRPVAQGADARDSALARREWQHSRRWARSRFQRRARSTAGGRCTSATAS